MPIAGLVITLSHVPQQAQKAREALQAMVGTRLGRPQGARLPLVLESHNLPEHQETLRAIERLDGVCLCEIAFADFADVGQAESGQGRVLQGENHYGSS